MKDEFWSIRKMREDQKGSQSRNTYKEKVEERPIVIKHVQKQKEKPSFNQFIQRLQLFLEE